MELWETTDTFNKKSNMNDTKELTDWKKSLSLCLLPWIVNSALSTKRIVFKPKEELFGCF